MPTKIDIAPTDFEDSALLQDLAARSHERIGAAFVALVAGEFEIEDPDFAEDLTRAARFVASVIVAQVAA